MHQNDYRNSVEGKRTQRLYADILPLGRPAPIRPPMDLTQRAKIFAPYDALRGFDEAITEVEEEAAEVPKEELSEEQQQDLSDQLSGIRKGMNVEAVFFIPGSSADKGQYIHAAGTVEQLDPIAQILTLRPRNTHASGQNPAAQGPIPKSLPLEIPFSSLLRISRI